ncbi:spermine synthase-like isoform X1 [Argiope bruennichi]|uniref:spermine synthase-like isoform X1 n=2 Tax=Argiope bruennichi TaxID=94029 RepID=UPI002494D34A|nr:spermine synthase-like isoform X1 [Argiope bruennichi]
MAAAYFLKSKEEKRKSERFSKMREVRTSMIDLQFDTNTLTDPEKRSNIVKNVEDILQSHFVKRKCEAAFGESYVVNFSNEDGSLTCTFKSYPFGLVTLTFEDCLEGDAAFTNPKLEEIRKELHRHFKVKVEKIPIIKRGSAVPLYFTTADERILEYDFNKVVFQDESPYQNIKILHSPTLGNCLILDDLQNLAESDINYTHGVMKYGSISYAGKEVLILGGGDGGLLHELLKENPKFVTMVDIDQMVIDACRIHLRGCCGDSLDKLEGPNYKVIIDDCLKKLDEYKETGKKFDVIINDLTDIPIATSPQGEMWDFVKKIINKSLVVLRDDGSYLNHALGESCVEALKTYEAMLSTLPVKVTFQRHSAYVPSFMENWVFYEIKKV